ncbi:unnamed protein product [Lymnaea stagnalis]|uniref:Uncharacterized protein n=1 Tax=Lymnaea stagnalis TaxID=6523 RepID=A0AAV2HSY2_LYMST
MTATIEEETSPIIAVKELLTTKNDGSIGAQWEGCQKNPGHRNLVSWLMFQSDPRKYLLDAHLSDDEVTTGYIKAAGELTVMLRMSYASPDRTKIYSSLYEFRGHAHNFFGSGLVVYDVEETENKCRCSKCYTSIVKPSAWKVFVATATHVVLDGREAEKLIAELYYHDFNDRRSVKKLYGIGISERSILGDCCVVECCTCDRLIAEEIRKFLKIQNELFPKLPKISKSSTVIISHPHGMPKYISFGECVGKDFKNSQLFHLSAWKYKTATCPGSSGAPALCMSDQFMARGLRFLVTNLHLHSGAGHSGNFSSISCQPSLHRKSSSGSIKETQASLPSTDLKTKKNLFPQSALAGRRIHPKGYFPKCEKHPRHEKFIPVRTLVVGDLPEKYRNDDVLNFIKTVSDLTCLIRVKCRSVNRPAVYPGSNKPYPLSGDNTAGHHFGTGYLLFNCGQNISDMKYCPCHLCEQLKTPNKEFCIVYIRTANTVVFDNVEAQRSVMTFETGSFGGHNMNGVRVISNNIDQDWSIIQCVTHKVELCQKFNSLRESLHKLDKIIRLKYNNEEHKLSIVVSHPHGCKDKQVTFGEFTGKQWGECNEDIYLENYTYSTPTCSGSSGAPVVMLGEGVPRINEHYITCHIHSDALEDYNKSGYVIDSLL